MTRSTFDRTKEMALTVLLLAGVSGGVGVPARGQAKPKPRECPAASVDTSAWVVTVDRNVGIEIEHPADYRAKRWESRSDTAGASLGLWRNAASRIDINEFRGVWSTQGPNSSVPPCVLRTRSAQMQLHLERTTRTLSTGRDTVYFVGKGLFSPPGKSRMLVEIGAPDSTRLLAQLAILRTIRFLTDR